MKLIIPIETIITISCTICGYLAGVLITKWNYRDKIYDDGLLKKIEREKIIKKLNEAFLPHNIECDGFACTGCWKDIVRQAIKMLEIKNK